MTTAAHPVLYEDGTSLDWPDAGYRVEVKVTASSAVVEHTLLAAPALSRLIEDGNAEWAVELRCPKTLFSTMTYHNQATANVHWDATDVDGEMYLLPGLVSVRAFELPTEGLSDVWGLAPIQIQPGSWLVRGDVRSANSLASSLLSFHVESDLDEGAMRVRPDTGNGDIHFNVFVSAGLLGACRTDRNVQMAALIAALARLPNLDQDDPQAEDPVLQYPSLQRVHDRLREQGVTTWLEDDFDPARAATALELFDVSLTDNEVDD